MFFLFLIFYRDKTKKTIIVKLVVDVCVCLSRQKKRYKIYIYSKVQRRVVLAIDKLRAELAPDPAALLHKRHIQTCALRNHVYSPLEKTGRKHTHTHTHALTRSPYTNIP